MEDYAAYVKIPRWDRDVIVTEKVDGINAVVRVQRVDTNSGVVPAGNYVQRGDGHFVVRAGGRARWLTVSDDNYGFAEWVEMHAEALAGLGPGLHYGEWYGYKINRGYDMPWRRFALFDVMKWRARDLTGDYGGRQVPECCDVVPILYHGTLADLTAPWTWASNRLDRIVYDLANNGSRLVPGYLRPEGVVIHDVASGQRFQRIIEPDEYRKDAAA